MQRTQFTSPPLLLWSGFLMGLILGAIASLSGWIVLGAKYLADTPATPRVDNEISDR